MDEEKLLERIGLIEDSIKGVQTQIELLDQSLLEKKRDLLRQQGYLIALKDLKDDTFSVKFEKAKIK